MAHKQARIIGVGAYLPEKILSNQDLEKLVDTTDEWIYTRTGMRERRLASSEEFSSTMGAQAAKKALSQAFVNATDLDLILVATMTPDYTSSNTAALIQELIGASRAGALDLQAACTGFIYALSAAKAYIESGMYRRILVVATEKMSAVVDYSDRSTCVLFGDGAAAVVVSDKGAGLGITNVSLGSNGALSELLYIPAGGSRRPATVETVEKGMHYIKMHGREIFKHAVRSMAAAARDCLNKAGVTEKDIEWIVPHQANERIIDCLAQTFEIPQEKVVKVLHKYGNTSASSIPIALEALLAEQKLEPGHRVLLLGFGAGLTYGAALLTAIPGEEFEKPQNGAKGYSPS